MNHGARRNRGRTETFEIGHYSDSAADFNPTRLVDQTMNLFEEAVQVSQKDVGRRPPPRPTPLPLSQFSHGELTMQDVKLSAMGSGCSILAKTSRGRNKMLAKVSHCLGIV
jgi:hypothetical protein